METLIHHPDFSQYPDGALFTEAAQPSGKPPGFITTDNDGQRALLYQIANNGMCYASISPKLDAGLDSVITVKNSIRLDTIAEVPYGWVYYVRLIKNNTIDAAFVTLRMNKGNLSLEVYSNWMDSQRYQKMWGSIDCGKADNLIHNISAQFSNQSVTIAYDDMEKVVQSAGAIGGDSLRCLGTGEQYGGGKKYRVLLVRDHLVTVS